MLRAEKGSSTFPERHYGAAAMVMTPWGLAADLRERKLSPGAGIPAAEIERSQRERLYGAMVACVAVAGYDRTSVADLLEVSGVSRRTFYELFRDKEDCFVAHLRSVTARGIAVRSPCSREGIRGG